MCDRPGKKKNRKSLASVSVLGLSISFVAGELNYISLTDTGA